MGCLLMLLMARTCFASLANCALINSNASDYKIVIDDFAFTSAQAQGDAELSALRDRLQFHFEGELSSLRNSAQQLNRSMTIPLSIVSCAGRKPSLSGSEFTRELVENLSDARVVVEMWGILDLRSAPGHAPTSSAMIGYAIPPVLRYIKPVQASGLQLIGYPRPGAARYTDDLENPPRTIGICVDRSGYESLESQSIRSRGLGIHQGCCRDE
jgi:hypothetical protein